MRNSKSVLTTVEGGEKHFLKYLVRIKENLFTWGI